MSDQNQPNFNPQELKKVSDHVADTATKAATENVTAEQQAKSHQDNFGSFSDGMPAVDPFGIDFGDHVHTSKNTAGNDKISSYGRAELLAWNGSKDEAVTDTTNASTHTMDGGIGTQIADMRRLEQKPNPTDDEKKELQRYHALLFELKLIMSQPDHVRQKVEYNALVGSSWLGGVGASGIFQSTIDDGGGSSNSAFHKANGALGGRVPDFMIHSHPSIFEGKQERPWWLFSTTDVKNISDQSRNFGHPITGYVLGPEGSVMRWTAGDKTYTEAHGVWGVPQVLGKFSAKGDFVPYKIENGKRVLDVEHTIEGSVIDSWGKTNDWGVKPK